MISIRTLVVIRMEFELTIVGTTVLTFEGVTQSNATEYLGPTFVKTPVSNTDNKWCTPGVVRSETRIRTQAFNET